MHRREKRQIQRKGWCWRMKGVKEVLTALSNGESTAVRVSTKEHEPMSDKRFDTILKRIVQGIFIVCAKEIVLESEPLVGFFVAVAILLFALMYLGFKDS